MKQFYCLVVINIFLLFGSQIQAQNIMKLGDVSVQAGQVATIAISIDNSLPFVAFQVDIPIPSGLTYIESSAALDVTRKDDHVLSVSIVSPNTLRLIGYSMSSSSFKGNSGSIVLFKLKAGQLPGNFSLPLNNPIIGDATSANILTSSVNGTVTILSPHIQLSAVSLDFGRVALGQTQDQFVTISNTGNRPLQVSEITFTNPQFTAIGGSSFSLESNGSKGITVRFTSQTKGTYKKEAMSVASNDPAMLEVIDSLKAVAFAVNEIHAGSITALSGQTKTLDFTINNMEPFTAFQFDIPLSTTMQYVIGSAKLLRNLDHEVSCSMINGNTLRVVAFSALNKLFTGTDGKVLSLDFKIAGQAGWYPININNGLISDATGLNAMSASYNGSLQVAAAQISTVPSLIFGDVSILSSKTQSLRVYNNGGDILKIYQLVFSDPSFTTTQSLPLAIQIGNYADIPVIFSKNSKGIINATIKIYSNDPITNPFSVNLNANAFAPNYINVKDFNGCVGTDVIVSIDVDNEEDFVALQCDLKYPSYLTPKTSAVILTDRKGDHAIQTNLLGNNTIRLVAFSMVQQSFTGKTGAVIQIPFTINANAVTGSYPLEISNGILGNSASQNILYGTNNGTVTINTPVGAAGAITGNSTVCKGVTENYTIPAITGATSYIWTLPSGSTGLSVSNSISVTFGSNAASGNIKVKGNNYCGDGSENSLAITVNNVPSVADIISGTIFTYKGTTETYTVPNITGATSYIWTLPTGVTGTSVTNTISVAISNSAVSGIIKVKGRNGCGDGTESSLAITVNTQGLNYLNVKEYSGCVGTEVLVAIEVENENAFVKLQCDLKYPEYLTPKTSEITLTARSVNHSVQASLLGNNILRLIASSSTLQSFTGKTGAVIQIPFTINANAVAGNYPLEISNGIIGTSSSQNILNSVNNGTITINNVPIAAGVITGNTTVCKGSTGTYTVPAITGATSYIWTLPSGVTGSGSTNTINVTFSNTAISGSFSVKGHNDCGDGIEGVTAITVNDIPSDAGGITGNTTVCKTATETYSVAAIVRATSYTWTLPTGVTGSSNSNTIVVTFGNATISGSIKVKGHNDCGDGIESAKAITLNDLPSAAGAITGSATVCIGITETFSVPAITGATSYVWTLPAGATGSSNTNSISLNFSNASTSGSIKVKGRNDCGDGVESIKIVAVNELPSLADAINGSSKVCKGTTEIYSVPAIAGATSYIWALPTGFTGSGSTNTISITFSNSAQSGSIKVKGHNDCGDGTENSLAIVVNDVSSAAGTITGNNTLCKGTTAIYNVPTIAGATSYIWTLPTGVTGASSTNTITVTIGNSATSGSIKVRGHYDCGDGTESKLDVTINDVPSSAGTISGNTFTYKGTTEIYTVPAITGAISYIWTLPTGVTGTSATNSITVTLSANAVSGNIKVKGQNDCGIGLESSLAITANTLGLNYLNIKEYKGCSGTDVIVTLDVENGSPFVALQCDLKYPAYLTPKTGSATLTDRATDHSLQVSLQGNNVLRVLAFSLSQQSFKGKTGAVVQIPFTINSNAVAGSYALELSNVTLGNSQSQNIIDNTFNGTLIISALPSGAGAITGTASVCKGVSETYTVPAIVGATSYLWTLPTGVTGASNTNSILVTIGNAATSGNIKVKGYNDCGEGNESIKTVTVNDIPSTAGSITGNISVCKGVTETYTVSAIAGATSYIWTLPTGVTGTSATNSILITIGTGSMSGNLKVKGRNGCGDGTESSLALTVNDIPSVAGTITGSNTLCQGVAEIYSVPAIAGATSYIWSLPTGITGTSKTNTISVTFSITAISGSIKVKGHNGCGDGIESIKAITVNDIPSAAGVISGNTMTYNYMGPIETYTVPAITGASLYIWTLPSGATGTSTTNSINVTIGTGTVSGNIKVKGQNGCGDGAESSLYITVKQGVYDLTVKGNPGCSGTDIIVTLEVDNSSSFIALQCDLKYPAYLTPKTTNIVLTDRATDHNVQASLLGNNTLRVLAYSLSLQSFKGTTGAVVQIPFTINSNAVAGSYALELSNVTLGNSQSQNIISNSYNGTAVINTMPSAAGVITGNILACKGTIETFTVPAITGATSYIWTLPTGVTGTSSTNTISVTFSNTATAGSIKVKGHNNCGDGTEASLAITICLGVGIEDVTLTNKVEVYPNPTSDVFYVTINKSFKNDFKIEVCNNFGQVMQTILKNKGENMFSVKLTNYPTGLYFVRFSDKEAQFYCKIVKQ